MRSLTPIRSEAQRAPSTSDRTPSPSTTGIAAPNGSSRWSLARFLGAARRRRPRPRTLDLALECRACRRTYRYEVETIYMDPAQTGVDPFIDDRIQCLGCGRWDDYAFTADAHKEILAEILRQLRDSASEGQTGQSPLVLVSLGLQDGQRMSPDDGLRDYERRLAEHPGDPALHIGYANILRFVKRIDEAEAGYRRALQLDPDAVEAHASLAQLAAERGDAAGAARGFERCLRILPRAHFYRLMEDTREEFVAAIKRDAERFGARAELGDAGLDIPHRSAARPAVGRNAPCPCGSGKKYKMCCLPADLAQQAASTPPGPGGGSAAEEELRKFLLAFAVRMPRPEQDRAMTLYTEVRPPSEDDAADGPTRTIGFLDWFINDHRLHPSGRTIVGEILAVHAHRLSPEARALLASWRAAPVSLYEVAAVEPGAAITLRHLLGAGEHRVRDVRGSNALARWDVVAARLIPIEGAMRVSATVIVFRPDEKPWLLAEVDRRYQDWRRTHPGSTEEQVLKADGLLFHRLAQELAECRRRQAENLTAVSAEGNALVPAKARYRMIDVQRILAALRSTEEFAPSEPGPGERACFVWLKLGESARLAVASGEVPAGAIQLSGAFCVTPDAAGIPTLGEIRIRGSRLVLQCLSRERLGWGQARLAELLGNAVRLEGETFEAIDTKRARTDRRSHARDRHVDRDAWDQQSEGDDETQRAVASRLLRDYYRRWIDQPLPALGGLSPRQAARVPVQGDALEALLRQIENLEDGRRRDGIAFCDIAWMRRELGR